MTAPKVVALAGGVGAARFLRGLVQVVPAESITVVVNTGDDRDFFGLRVCPDLDIVTYSLASAVRRDTGWGLEGDTFECLDAMKRFDEDVWFQLGDRDLATHIHRTRRLKDGVSLSETTREIVRSFGVDARLLPMSEDPAPTYVVRSGGHRVHFEEYLVRERSPDDVEAVDLSASASATPAPGVLDALTAAEHLIVCPSNPVVSIGTIRAVKGVEDALRARADAVCVSPIIGGAPVKGPADRLLRAIGSEVSALGVARLYQPIAHGIVIDEADRALADPIRELGLSVRVEETLMRDDTIAASLAEATVALARSGA